MFKQRVITAIPLVLGFLALLFNLNPLNFSLVMVSIVLLAGWEWSNLMGLQAKTQKSVYLALLVLILGVAGLSLDLFGALNVSLGQTFCLAASCLWAVIFLWVQGYPSSAILWSPRPILGLLGLLLLSTHLGCYCAYYPSASRRLVVAFRRCSGRLSGYWGLCGRQSVWQTQVGATGQSRKNLGRLLWRHSFTVHFIAAMASFMPEKILHCYALALVIPCPSIRFSGISLRAWSSVTVALKTAVLSCLDMAVYSTESTV